MKRTLLFSMIIGTLINPSLLLASRTPANLDPATSSITSYREIEVEPHNAYPDNSLEDANTDLPLYEESDITSHVDNLDFLETSANPEEFAQSLINLIIGILDNPNLSSKEALTEYIAEHLTKLVKTRDVHLNISVSAQKRSEPNEIDKETQYVIANAAGMASSFFGILQNPNCSRNVALNLSSLIMNVVNVAMLAIHPEPITEKEIRRLITIS